jgi:Tol biopolymer transport system component
LKRIGHITLGLVLLIGLIPPLTSIGSTEERPVQLTEAKEAFICPAYSPDGSRIAVTREDWQGIWLIQTDGTRLRKLTDDPGAGYRFAWSPDGSQIVYRTEEWTDGKRYFSIRTVDIETRRIEKLTDFQQYLGIPHWVLGDGTVAFETDRHGTLAQAMVVGQIPPRPKEDAPHRVATTSRDLCIWVSEADGSGRKMVSDPDEHCFDPVLSPDENRVCYSVLSGGGSIAVAAVDGSGSIDVGYGSNPSWSPDSRYLVFEVTEDDGHVITGSDLCIAAADGSGRIQLTDTPERFERWPSWSPDGRRIVYSAGGAIFILTVPESLQPATEEAP